MASETRRIRTSTPDSVAASDNLNPSQMRLVKTKSIPNVDDERLTDSLMRIHQSVHTAEGLHTWDKPRRGLYDLGMKALKIKKELDKRNVSSPVNDCKWCS